MSRHSHTHAADAPAEVLDPVCGMTISPDDAVGHVDHKSLRNAEALEVPEKVTTFVVDKTSTLTEGKPKLVTISQVELQVCGGRSNSPLRAETARPSGAVRPPRSSPRPRN